jgi:predicted phage terminase large subunit-like protein
MEAEKIYAKIKKAVLAHPEDPVIYEDMFTLCRQTDHPDRYKWNVEMRGWLRDGIASALDKDNVSAADTIYHMEYKSLLLGAPVLFDDYLQAVEYGKAKDKQFYRPRRHYLKRYTDAYQDVADGKLDFLSISMPKRCGKSQMGINYVNWISGRRPDRSTLMEGTGDDLVKSFYNGCLEYIVQPNDYHYFDIFPDCKLVETHADTKVFNLNHRSRFPTVMCRSIDARQVGLSEATNLLYLDDCVEGREEAKNRQRLDDKWEVISGDIIGRAIEGTPIVICGTRYSLYDPIGHLQEEMQKQGKRSRIIEIPALDPITDESNFEYIRDGERVFTTKYFRDQREMLSAEQFESEFQQQPFEAKGLLFPEKELNYYFELPIDKDPDAIVAVCDTADKGSDSCSMPVAAVYGDDVFIVDVVFDDSPPDVTKPECAKCLMNNHVSEATFESNNAGEYFARDVNDLLASQFGYRCSIRTKRTISNKQTRIEFASDNIKKHFWFKHPSTYKRGSQYAMFMKEVVTYTRSGKVPHDDAPDSLSLMENELRKRLGSKIEIFDRLF